MKNNSEKIAMPLKLLKMDSDYEAYKSQFQNALISIRFSVNLQKLKAMEMYLSKVMGLDMHISYNCLHTVVNQIQKMYLHLAIS